MTGRPKTSDRAPRSSKKPRSSAEVVPISAAVESALTREETNGEDARETTPRRAQLVTQRAELAQGIKQKAANRFLHERSLTGLLLQGLTPFDDDPVVGILTDVEKTLELVLMWLEGHTDDPELLHLSGVLYRLQERLKVAAELYSRNQSQDRKLVEDVLDQYAWPAELDPPRACIVARALRDEFAKATEPSEAGSYWMARLEAHVSHVLAMQPAAEA